MELKCQVDFSNGHIQKAQNPTVNKIVKRLKKFEKIYEEEEVEVSAQREKRSY